MGQSCFARWRLLSVVVCRRRLSSSSATLPVGGRAGRRTRGRSAAAGPGQARERSGGRRCTAGQYGYVQLGRHLVNYFLAPNFVVAAKFVYTSLIL